MNNAKTHGIWWNIAGAGWVSAMPEHHNQLEMFGGCPHHSWKHVPFWGGKPLAFTQEEATQLAQDFSTRGRGPYIAKPLTEIP